MGTDAMSAMSSSVAPGLTTEAGVRRATEQISRITYLASLASRFEDIDPILDPLRGFTAHWNKTTPLTPTEQAALDDVEAKLKAYLLRTDPLRAFTPESLEARIHESVKGSGLDNASRNLMLVSILSVLSLGFGFVLPFDLSFQGRLLLAAPMLFTVLGIGTVWFYFSSLRNFKEDVRRVFLFFCAAAIIFAVGFSQFPFIELFDLTRYPEFRYVGIAVLFAIPFAMIFFGLRLYAKLLEIRSPLLLWRSWLPFVVGAVLIAVLLPHKPVASEPFFRMAAASGMAIFSFGLMGSLLASKIRKHATAAYSRPMTALLWYLRLTWPSGLATVVLLFVIGELQGVALNIVLIACGIVPQSILLLSGYLFKRETSR